MPVIEHSEFSGFQQEHFTFQGQCAKVLIPAEKANGKWAIKTEYFGAFPELEIELLKRGWHVAFIQNDNRWAEEKDLHRKCDFIRFVSEKYRLETKCAGIGMSCGGLFAVKTAAMCPDLFNCLYLDAPVMNLLSCPCGLGDGANFFAEYHQCTGRTISQMLNYRQNPVDLMYVLAEHHIPIILVAGDDDHVVPYKENGEILEEYYRKQGEILEVHLKKNADHHPHGLKDPRIIADFLEKHSARQSDVLGRWH